MLFKHFRLYFAGTTVFTLLAWFIVSFLGAGYESGTETSLTGATSFQIAGFLTFSQPVLSDHVGGFPGILISLLLTAFLISLCLALVVNGIRLFQNRLGNH